MVVIGPREIADNFVNTEFKHEQHNQDAYFTRTSAVPELFERIELSIAGRARDTIVVSVALSVVLRVSLQFRGLILRAGLEEVCTDPANGRVQFSSRQDLSYWLDKLNDTARRRLAELARNRGPELLRQTAGIRNAGAIALSHVSDAQEPGSIESRLPEAQREIYRKVLAVPEVSRNAFGALSQLAVCALVLSGDPDVASIGRADSPSREVGIQKVRYLVDVLHRHDRR